MISIEGERIPYDVPVETAGEFNGVERCASHVLNALCLATPRIRS